MTDPIKPAGSQWAVALEADVGYQVWQGSTDKLVDTETSGDGYKGVSVNVGPKVYTPTIGNTSVRGYVGVLASASWLSAEIPGATTDAPRTGGEDTGDAEVEAPSTGETAGTDPFANNIEGVEGAEQDTVGNPVINGSDVTTARLYTIGAKVPLGLEGNISEDGSWKWNAGGYVEGGGAYSSWAPLSETADGTQKIGGYWGVGVEAGVRHSWDIKAGTLDAKASALVGHRHYSWASGTQGANGLLLGVSLGASYTWGKRTKPDLDDNQDEVIGVPMDAAALISLANTFGEANIVDASGTPINPRDIADGKVGRFTLNVPEDMGIKTADGSRLHHIDFEFKGGNRWELTFWKGDTPVKASPDDFKYPGLGGAAGTEPALRGSYPDLNQALSDLFRLSSAKNTPTPSLSGTGMNTYANTFGAYTLTDRKPADVAKNTTAPMPLCDITTTVTTPGSKAEIYVEGLADPKIVPINPSGSTTIELDAATINAVRLPIVNSVETKGSIGGQIRIIAPDGSVVVSPIFSVIVNPAAPAISVTPLGVANISLISAGNPPYDVWYNDPMYLKCDNTTGAPIQVKVELPGGTVRTVTVPVGTAQQVLVLNPSEARSLPYGKGAANLVYPDGRRVVADANVTIKGRRGGGGGGGGGSGGGGGGGSGGGGTNRLDGLLGGGSTGGGSGSRTGGTGGSGSTGGTAGAGTTGGATGGNTRP